MQIKTKDGWQELHVRDRPKQLSGQMILDVAWEPESLAFKEAMNASAGCRRTLFRASECAPEQLFWVLLSRIPDVRRGKPTFTCMLLTPADWCVP